MFLRFKIARKCLLRGEIEKDLMGKVAFKISLAE